ncbi:hypothetical protein [Cytophaga aurantiaca]|uniref:hypothetical protein n=1 Tax=Cytophaga aurantiaca TaxID=29530 RepID=UPI00037E9318|nr:hypothetical protein [Cytophaga aurantiaca]
MKRVILTIFILANNILSFSQKNERLEIPAGLNAFKFADIIESKYENGKVKKSTQIEIYGFDDRKNLIYNIDSKGLYLEYKYDSTNNLTEEFFYEKFDSIGKRIPSSKWKYEYENGLRKKIIRYKYSYGTWKYEETVTDQYLLNSIGQIIEHKYFDSENKIKEIVYSYYLDPLPIHNKYFDFNDEGRITKYYCRKEVTTDSLGTIKDSTIYNYDTDYNIIKQIEYTTNSSTPRVETYKYDKSKNIIEETLYIGFVNQYFTKRLFEYNKEGFVTKYTSINSNGDVNWIRIYQYK